MKLTNLLLFSFVIIGIQGFGQSAYLKKIKKPSVELRIEYYVSRTDTNVWNGPYALYFENNLLLKGQYVNNQKQGFWEKYYTNGKISQRGEYLEGNKTGMWQYFYENGQLASTFYFKNNLRHGTWRGYYADGNNATILNFSNDTLLGERVYYHKNGTIGLYENIEKVGSGILISSKLYYEDGKIYLEKQTYNDTINGIYKKFHPSGVVWEHFIYYKGVLTEVIEMKNNTGFNSDLGTFRNGNGELKRYHHNGSLYSIENFKNGLKHGKAQYFENDILRTDGFYVNGYQAGTWRYFSQFKKQLFERIFFEDKPVVFEKEFGASGKELEEGELLHGHRNGIWKSYNFYGEQYSQKEYKKGYLHGNFLKQEGSIVLEKGGYYYGEKVGKWQSYNNKGKVVYERNFTKEVTFDSVLFYPKNVGLPPEPTTAFNLAYEFYDPVYVGTSINIRKYILDQIVDPPAVKQYNLTGNVEAAVFIDNFGVVEQVSILKGIGFGCDQEVERVLLNLPPFEPALENGIPFGDVLIKIIGFGKPD